MTQGKPDTSAANAVMRRQMKRTFDPRVIAGRGNLHGLFRLDYGRERLLRRNYKSPVLVTRTAGLGPTAALAARLGIHDTISFDVVARAVNDLVATGAEPLMFVPHLAMRERDAAMQPALIKGLADGCVEAGCALLAADAPPPPGLSESADRSTAFDLTGFALGVVNENRIIDGSLIRSGDVVLGLATDSLQGSGGQCIAQVIHDPRFDPDQPLRDMLLTSSRIYAKPIQRVLRYYRRKIAVVGMAHITGGGIPGNLTRVFPETLDADLRRDAWPVPPVFNFLQSHGHVPQEEMDDVFNLGIGYIMIVRPKYADSVMKQLKRYKEEVYLLGTMVKGSGQVRMG